MRGKIKPRQEYGEEPPLENNEEKQTEEKSRSIELCGWKSKK